MGIVLSEVTFRLVKRVVCLGEGAKLFRPHPLYGWTHMPHAEGWTYRCAGRSFEWRAFSRIDAAGLRDREYPLARRPGVRRVLLLGDSFTEGMQVPLEQTFAKRLEATLAAHGREVEVIDGGFSGFGTDNELLFFRADGRHFRPDVVLLGFTAANDVIENSTRLYRRMYAEVRDGAPPKSHFKLRADGSLGLDTHGARRHWEEYEAERATLAGRLWTALEDNVHLVRLFAAVVWRPRVRPDATRVARATALGVYDTHPPPEWERAWALTRALVRQLKVEVEREHATLGAFVIPSKETVSPVAWRTLLALWPEHTGRALDPERPVVASVAALREEQVPVLDLLPALRSHLEATGRSGYFVWDVHFDEDGHAVVADALAPFVERMLEAHDQAG